MIKTPKSLRLHVGLFGRTNVGKSSFLNYIAGQDVAITSSIPGTTTDIVEKAMELLPLGPVLFLDTAGLDDKSALAEKRIKKSQKVFIQTDVAVLLVESDIWTSYEDAVIREIKERQIPLIIVINKVDVKKPSKSFIEKIKRMSQGHLSCSTINASKQEDCRNIFKRYLIELCPDDFLKPPSLIGDILPVEGLSILIVPIDLEAPKGRLILPQVQTIRDVLDNDTGTLIVKESQYCTFLKKLKKKPDLVVCDSQVVDRMVEETPENVKCTTFSILFSRFKGDLIEMVKGANMIDHLKKNDKVLIAESCTHHPLEDDIGRIKIPKWMKEYVGGSLEFDVCSGKDYPEDLTQYKLIIHCGACMLNRKMMLSHIQQAKDAHVPITNYGVCISKVQGVLKRVLEPFPLALDVYSKMKNRK